MFLDPDGARALAAKIITNTKAETCTVAISGTSTRNFRFAKNNATTNGAISAVSVTIESSLGKKVGTATVHALDEASLKKGQARSEEIARLSPENPEFMPPLPPQTYEMAGHRFDSATAGATASSLAEAASTAISARNPQIEMAGYAEAGGQFSCLANSAGLFVYDRATAAELTVTARNTKRAWSGWAGGSHIRQSALNPAALGGKAAAKASASGEPADLDPGVYTVVLEPAAVADLVLFLAGSMDARAATEGRSYLSKPGGGTKIGERILSECVTIASDPNDPIAPDRIFGEDGVPARRTVWFERGTVTAMSYSRYWAQKMDHDPVPRPGSLIMEGGTATTADMIASIKRGVLITRLWYIRTVDPRTLLLTGMTRDGNFLIENGRVTRPALNLRFNESPVSALSKIEALGPAERVIGSETYGSAISVPPLLISGFTFSSRSSGI
jgi:predicted Zn-dependent protease